MISLAGDISMTITSQILHQQNKMQNKHETALDKLLVFRTERNARSELPGPTNSKPP